MSKQQLKKKTSSFFVPLLKIYVEDDAEKEEEEERQRESESQPRRTKTGDGEHRERIRKGGSYGKWCAVVSHTFFFFFFFFLFLFFFSSRREARGVFCFVSCFSLRERFTRALTSHSA